MHALPPRDGVLLAFGDGETSFSVRPHADGYELLRSSHSAPRPVAIASHLDDAIRLLAVAVLPRRGPQLDASSVREPFAIDAGPEAAVLFWDDSNKCPRRVRITGLALREELAARLARCAEASLDEIAASMFAPDGAPLLAR